LFLGPRTIDFQLRNVIVKSGYHLAQRTREDQPRLTSMAPDDCVASDCRRRRHCMCIRA
jgi:hypothetical protein